MTNKHFKAHLYCLFALFTPTLFGRILLTTLPPTHIVGEIMVQQNKGNGKVNIFIFLYLLILYQKCLKLNSYKFITPLHNDTIPRRCLCFTIISLIWSVTPPPLTRPKLLAPSYGTNPFFTHEINF